MVVTVTYTTVEVRETENLQTIYQQKFMDPLLCLETCQTVFVVYADYITASVELCYSKVCLSSEKQRNSKEIAPKLPAS